MYLSSHLSSFSRTHPCLSPFLFLHLHLQQFHFPYPFLRPEIGNKSVISISISCKTTCEARKARNAEMKTHLFFRSSMFLWFNHVWAIKHYSIRVYRNNSSYSLITLQLHYKQCCIFFRNSHVVVITDWIRKWSGHRLRARNWFGSWNSVFTELKPSTKG